MTRLMLDGINSDAPAMARYPGAISFAAGYVDGLYRWSAADWALFPNSAHVRIAVFASTNDGHVLDCEPGNCTPAQSVDWVLMRRAAGVDPTVYCGRNTWWNEIRGAFQARKVPEPHYWVADYSVNQANPQIPAGAVALQYRDAGPYDLSVVAAYWPGIDEGADMPLTPADAKTLYDYVEESVLLPDGRVVGASLGNLAHGAWVAVNDLNTGNAALGAKLDAIAAAVSKFTAPSVDPAAVAAAVKAEMQDPGFLRALAHAIAVELHDDTPAA